MTAPEEDFETYLRHEVNAAGERYEQSVQQMLALSNGPGPGLAHATAVLAEDFRLYTGALRRMAHWACRPAPPIRVVETRRKSAHRPGVLAAL